MQVSIIVTALNEEKNIFNAINNTLMAFKDFNILGEIIVINDGSTDGTGSVVQSSFVDNKDIHTVTHDKPHGVGASFWEGVDNARGEVVAWLPGDNQTDPWEVLRYFSLLDHVDIVIPFIYDTKVRSLARRMLSSMYRSIINTTFSTNFNYTNGSILYRKLIFDRLTYRSSSFFFQTDILIRLSKMGCMFAEVPFRLGIREHGVSKAVSFPSLISVIKGYFYLLMDIYFRRRITANTTFADDTQTSKRRREKV